MKIRELVEALEDFAAEHGEDVEVRLQSQEQWPFVNALLGVVGSDEVAAARRDEAEGEDGDDPPDEDEVVEAPVLCVYLVEGAQLAYGDKEAFSLARSRR
jgi:hypothetical protein